MVMNYLDWTVYKRGVISTRAPHVDLGKVDEKALFAHFKGAAYIRYVSDFDKALSEKYYNVIKDGEFSMSMIPAKTRNMVRRCLNNCAVQIVDYHEIINGGGYDVYLSECRRFAKKGFSAVVKNFERWKEGIQEAQKNGQVFWGVLYDDKVIAYAVTRVKDKMVDLVTWKCDYERYNKLYPSYGLVYVMTEYYLKQPNILYVNDGNKSFTEHSAVQEMLIDKFGYRKAFSNLHVKFKWWLKVMLVVLSPFESHIKNNVLLSLIRMYKWSV